VTDYFLDFIGAGLTITSYSQTIKSCRESKFLIELEKSLKYCVRRLTC